MVPFLVSSDEGLDPRQYTFRSLPPFVHTYGPISEGPLISSLPLSRYRVCPNISIRTRSYSITTSEDPLHVLRYICNADYFRQMRNVSVSRLLRVRDGSNFIQNWCFLFNDLEGTLPIN